MKSPSDQRDKLEASPSTVGPFCLTEWRFAVQWRYTDIDRPEEGRFLRGACAGAAEMYCRCISVVCTMYSKCKTKE